MAKTTFSLEDVIADEVKKATAGIVPGPVRALAPAVQAAPAADAGLPSIDIKSITGLLREVNTLMASRGAAPAAGGAPAAPSGAPPAGLGGVPLSDRTPAQNPRPTPAAPVLDPEKIYTLVLSSIGQIQGVLGDVPLSEVAAFMEGNRPVVVSLIAGEVGRL